MKDLCTAHRTGQLQQTLVQIVLSLWKGSATLQRPQMVQSVKAIMKSHGQKKPKSVIFDHGHLLQAAFVPGVSAHGLRILAYPKPNPSAPSCSARSRRSLQLLLGLKLQQVKLVEASVRAGETSRSSPRLSSEKAHRLYGSGTSEVQIFPA